MIQFPQADRDAVVAFVDCLFRYAEGYINLRAFHDLKDGAPPLFVEPIRIGATDFIERVCDRIHEAAAHPEPHVFCPPVCSFSEPNGAATENLAEGVALSVECDSNPYAALKRLAGVLGKPTVVVATSKQNYICTGASQSRHAIPQIMRASTRLAPWQPRLSAPIRLQWPLCTHCAGRAAGTARLIRRALFV
jgi:hypothetical protein